MKYLPRTAAGLVVTAVALLLAACAGNAQHESTGEYIDDAALTAKVKTALVKADETKARNIEVETFKGKVQLSGFVDSRDEAQAAVRIARGVEGVVDVADQMTVK